MARIPNTSRILIKQSLGAIVLNGTSQYVDLGNLGPISTLTGAFTLAGWFKKTSLGTQSVVGDRGVGAIQRFNLTFNTAYRSTTSITTSGGGTGLTLLSAYPLYGWEHNVLKYDTANSAFFRKGVKESSAPRAGTVSAPTGNMAIGSGNGGVRFWAGLIADVKLWGRALSDAECFDIYANRDDTDIRSGMIGEWKLSSDANDTFGSNNGTAVASPTFTTTDVPFGARTLASNRVLSSGRTLIT